MDKARKAEGKSAVAREKTKREPKKQQATANRMAARWKKGGCSVASQAQGCCVDYVAAFPRVDDALAALPSPASSAFDASSFSMRASSRRRLCAS